MAFNASVASTLSWLYLGAFARPPLPSSDPLLSDPDGLAFWTDQYLAGGMPFEGDVAAIADFFVSSPEFQATYGDLNDSQFVSALYANMLGRAPDLGGLTFWLGRLDSGESRGTILADFANTSEFQDLPRNEGFKEAVESFIVALSNGEAPEEWLANNPDLDPVNIDTNPGETSVLTTGVDIVPGTAGNDTVVGLRDGADSTFTVGDEIDGGGGNDTLRIVSNESGLDLSLADITSIENLSLRASANIGAVDLAGNEFEMVNIDGQNKVQSSDATIGNIAADSAITVEDADFNNRRLDIDVTEQTDPVDVTVTLKNIDDARVFLDLDASGDGSSNDDTVNLFLDGVKNTDGDMNFYTTDAETFNVTVVSDSELENIGNYYNNDGSPFGPAVVNLVADADLKVDFWDLSDTSDVTTTFNITGAGNVSIADFDDGSSDVTVDGSAATGDLELLDLSSNFLAVTTGSGNDTVEINNAATVLALGDGDDKAIVDTNLTTADSDLDGGAGDADVLSVANSIATSGDDFSDNIAGFERLEIGKVPTGDNAVVDLSNFDGVDYVISPGTGPTTGTAEVQRINLGSSDADGGVLNVGGVGITIPSNPFLFFNEVIVASAIAAQEAAIIAANPDVVSVDSVFLGGFDYGVDVTYNTTSGNVPNISVADSPSGVTFGPVVQTDGTDEVAQTDTLTINTAPTSTGLITVSIDNDGSNVTTETDIQVQVIAGETVDQVAANIAGAIAAANLTGVSSVSAVNEVVTVNYNANLDLVGQINFDDTGSTGVTVTEDTPQAYVAPVGETQVVAITNGTDADGGEIVVAGVRIALDGNLTPNQVAGQILNNLTAITAASDVVAIAFDSTTSELTFNFDEDAGNVPAIQIEDNASTGVGATVSQIVPGVAGAAAGTLTLDAMASGGTLELTGALGGELTVNVTEAALAGSANDDFNIKLNGTQQLDNTAALKVSAVETINIETANSDEDNLPTGASTLNLQAAAAETVTVTGNHGVDFSGSDLDLSSMTLLDASGVQATESSAGVDNAGTVGAVTIDIGATDADVTILTGNGDDSIDVSFAGTGTTDEVDGTVNAGAGDDTVTGSMGDDAIDLGAGDDTVSSSGGEDTITLGAGNDIYALVDSNHSVINSRDVITDFSANTATTDGDVIDLQGVTGLNDVNVAVFTNAADATTFLANSAGAGQAGQAVNAALDSSTSFLYLDVNDSGIADSVIELAGVTTIDEAAFVV